MDTQINIESVMSHLWTLESALVILRPLETMVAKTFDAHVALAGSVLYRGWSDNDLDIHIYPRGTTSEDGSVKHVNKTALFGALMVMGYSEPKKCAAKKYDGRRVVYETSHEGRKINLFFPELDV